MQNEQTLIDLGFVLDEHGEYVWRQDGKDIFVAFVIDCNGPIYVQLFRVSDKVDTRPLSPHKGRYLRSLIKDCCSVGSIERTINKHYYGEHSP